MKRPTNQHRHKRTTDTNICPQAGLSRACEIARLPATSVVRGPALPPRLAVPLPCPARRTTRSKQSWVDFKLPASNIKPRTSCSYRASTLLNCALAVAKPCRPGSTLVRGRSRFKAAGLNQCSRPQQLSWAPSFTREAASSSRKIGELK